MEKNKEEGVFGELPENAFRELKPGEEYQPVMSPKKVYPEATVWSVTIGVLMAVLFSAATAYLGLKVGQVFEAAIPIAIIAVGLSSGMKRKNALGENVIIQSIGSSSGVIVAGAIFTLPALYILQAKYPEISVSFFQVFLSSLLGGVLGILFLIPFRKYFVSDMHGKYPFPEATATTQVLVSGEKSGGQAKTLIFAGLIGGLYDFIIGTFGAWSEVVTSRIAPIGIELADKAKLVFKINVGAAVLGLGFIVGLKYTAIICAGSALIWFVIVPVLPLLGDGVSTFLNPAVTSSLSSLSPEDIFNLYGKNIGIGAIAMAGIIGIVKSRGVIVGAGKLAVAEMKGDKSSKETEAKTLRTQRDLPMKLVLGGLVVTLVCVFLFFYFGVIGNILFAVVGILLVTCISFLFTTVAANAIAIVGSNPVSGMTLMTLILTSLILVAVGLKGEAGMMTAMIIGGVVCTALSMAGALISDLKVGYWLGSTPAKQESWKFLGTLVSAATVGGVMILLNDTYGFSGKDAFAAPQANAMAAVIEPLMTGGSAPWYLYGIGAVIALLLTLFNIPALAFALGMFIPFYLNIPLLVGGIASWYVGSRSKDTKLNSLRVEKGTLIASGMIAGGALMGVVSAGLRFADINFIAPGTAWADNWVDSTGAEVLAIFMYALLIGYLIYDSMKAKNEKL